MALRRDDAFVIRPFRRDMQLRRGTRRLVPRAFASRLERLAHPVEPKWVLRREEAKPCFADHRAPDRIWVIGLDRRLRHGRIRRLDQAEVLAALIQGSSPLYLGHGYPQERAALMPVLCALAERVPGWGIRLGRALVEDPAGELDRLTPAGSLAQD
jgi:hypothetical protein